MSIRLPAEVIDGGTLKNALNFFIVFAGHQ